MIETTPAPEPMTESPVDMNTRFDLGSLVAGLVFMALGLAFMLEANGQWTFQLDHFRYVGPLVLIVIGISILAGAGLDRHFRLEEQG